MLEVVDYVATANTKFSENAIQEAVRMVSANVFRTLNPQPRENKVINDLNLEVEEHSMDPTSFKKLIASPETEKKLIVYVLPFLLHPSKIIIQTSSGLFIIQSLHEILELYIGTCMKLNYIK